MMMDEEIKQIYRIHSPGINDYPHTVEQGTNEIALVLPYYTHKCLCMNCYHLGLPNCFYQVCHFEA